MARRSKRDPVFDFFSSPIRGRKLRKDKVSRLVKKVKPAKTKLGYILTGKGKPAKRKKDKRTKGAST